jgi:RNA polymerase sigma-70 factor (ECF subfamily)
VALSNVDRELLDDCFSGSELAWRMFCDRYVGLIVQVVTHTTQSLGIAVDPLKREELVSETLASMLDRDFSLLKRFRGESSLGTYVTVIARRLVLRRLQSRP